VRIDESRETERTERTPDEERWYLTDEREFLERSLADADRERDAGDLSVEDHALLVGRDRSRLGEVQAELAALNAVASPSKAVRTDRARPTQAARTTMPWWRRLGIIGSCLLIAVGLVILVVHFVQARQPGQASSGSVSVSQAQLIEQQLQQADALNQQGSTKSALVLYNKVLSEDPSNPHGLAYAGFLQWNVGSTAGVPSLTRVGRSEIETAIAKNPSYGQAHLFYGLVLENQDHNHAAAVAQFNDFLEDAPPAAELAQTAPLVAGAYKGAGVPLPAQFSATTTTTTTTTTTSTPTSTP
jgi:tetratricopeptide (TPR) repeat protein